jgi:hypothetical protein
VIKVREGMRSIRRTLRRPSLLPKSQWNRSVLLRSRYTTLWRSEIHINENIDADAGVPFVSTVQCIIPTHDSEGSMLVSGRASTVYAVGRIT